MEKCLLDQQNILAKVSPESFQVLYSGLNSYCKKYVGREDAQDIVMHAFIKILEKDRPLHQPAKLGSYLRKIAYNKIMDLKKARKISYTLDLNTLELPGDMNECIQNADKQKRIGVVSKEIALQIENLPGQCRQVFKLHLQQKTVKEISNKLAINSKTVYAHCAHARAKIYASLKKKGMIDMYVD